MTLKILIFNAFIHFKYQNSVTKEELSTEALETLYHLSKYFINNIYISFKKRD